MALLRSSRWPSSPATEPGQLAFARMGWTGRLVRATPGMAIAMATLGLAASPAAAANEAFVRVTRSATRARGRSADT